MTIVFVALIYAYLPRSTKEMKHYKTLTTSAIYRDGGSIEARFQCADKSFERFPELSVQQLKIGNFSDSLLQSNGS
jgi:hypothetical protein